jgi:putative tryptophan/tyrosine transport system substrate-binding protein
VLPEHPDPAVSWHSGSGFRRGAHARPQTTPVHHAARRRHYRWGTGDPERARAFTTELLSLAPDVIVAHGTPALTALHRATRTIPVVFVSVIDPVGAGYVKSLPIPGANITGFSTFEPEIGGKWLELLKEIAPGVTRVAGILDPGFRGFAGIWAAIENMAPKFGLHDKSGFSRAGR